MKWIPTSDCDGMGRVWTSPDLPGWEIVPHTNHRWGREERIGWGLFNEQGVRQGIYSYLAEAKDAAEALAGLEL